jgi:hypothetical protein
MENSNLNSYWFGQIEALVSSIDYIAIQRALTTEEAEKAMLVLGELSRKCESLKKNIESKL